MIYNELLNEYLNHYNNLYATMNSERGISLLEYDKQKAKLNGKIETHMKHFVFFGTPAATVISIDTIAHADALKASKSYFKIEEENNETNKEEASTQPEKDNQRPITKAYLLHRYKNIFDKYKDSFRVCTKQSATEAMSRSMKAELDVVNDYAIGHGMNMEEVTAILNEATELWGVHNCMSK